MEKESFGDAPRDQNVGGAAYNWKRGKQNSGKSASQALSRLKLILLQTGKILGILKESLTSVPSVSIDPSMFMVSKPEPKEGATHNGDQLPALLIFLLNQLSKSVIAQFIDEAGVSTAAADPVGILVASVFSQKDLLWRGKPLIDILMAKMRVVCPVLFGLRGSEKTEEGRARLGWKRINGNWIDDQTHNTRMTGLGAGYAAISLRDFSNSQWKIHGRHSITGRRWRVLYQHLPIKHHRRNTTS